MNKFSVLLALVALSAMAGTASSQSPEQKAAMEKAAQSGVAQSGANMTPDQNPAAMTPEQNAMLAAALKCATVHSTTLKCEGLCEMAGAQCTLSKAEQQRFTLQVVRNQAAQDNSAEGQAGNTMLQGGGGVLAVKCSFTQASGPNSEACKAEKGCKVQGTDCIPEMKALSEAVGDKCKGIGIFAQLSLDGTDGNPAPAAMQEKMKDGDFASAALAISAQGETCQKDAACAKGNYCIKAGTDCEPDFMPFFKSLKCSASIMAKATKAQALSKAAEVKKAKAKVATAKVAVTNAKAKKEAADAKLATCGDSCSDAEKTEATAAKTEYEEAQRVETAAAAEESNKVASAANADAAAQTGAAESGAAQVAVGAAVVLGVLTAQLF